MLAARRPLTLAESEAALAVESRHQTLEGLQRAMKRNVNHIAIYLHEMLGTLVRISNVAVPTAPVREGLLFD